jgi:ATP-dependent RNA helicase DeaD
MNDLKAAKSQWNQKKKPFPGSSPKPSKFKKFSSSKSDGPREQDSFRKPRRDRDSAFFDRDRRSNPSFGKSRSEAPFSSSGGFAGDHRKFKKDREDLRNSVEDRQPTPSAERTQPIPAREKSHRTPIGEKRRSDFFGRDARSSQRRVRASGAQSDGPKVKVKKEPMEFKPLSDEIEAKISKSRILIPGKRSEVIAAAVESEILFSDLDLPEELLSSLEEANFTSPTPIQEKSLPFSLEGRDVMGCAQTGTGKTVAFVLPMLKTLMEDEEALALVLAPTRELAAQILETLRLLCPRNGDLAFTLLIGGSSFSEQVRSLRRRPRILVATPGRLVDHIQQRTVSLQNVKFFVLDEADRMFDMGFAPQIRKITQQIPKEKQTLLFSATFNKEVKSLALTTLRNPQEVFVGETSSVATGVEQEIIEITAEQKFPKLLDELNKREGSVLLFVGMKYKADRLAKSLEDYGHSVDSIHGGRTQGQRRAVLNAFREQRIRILVATDVAARGLDIPHVAHVVNYDMPNDPEDYVHRIGRTARAGAIGKALSFVTSEDQDSWKRISRLLKLKGEGGNEAPSAGFRKAPSRGRGGFRRRR